MKKNNFLLFLLLILSKIYSFPFNSIMNGNLTQTPKIQKLQILSLISNRFCTTTVKTEVENSSENPLKFNYFTIIPENAYVTSFIMEMDGKNYTGIVKEIGDAIEDFNEGIKANKTVAYLDLDLKDSYKISTFINIAALSNITFYLSYEELLVRKGHYEVIVNIYPRQIVNVLSVTIQIKESKPLSFIKILNIRQNSSLINSDFTPEATIQSPNDKTAIIHFNSNEEKQKKIANTTKGNELEGFSGQFIVQYDIHRQKVGGEVLIRDGHFVHFFSPSNLPPLSKHVVFVVDTSGSMLFKKIDQVKEAMKTILKDLRVKDLFHLVEFNNNVKVWNVCDLNASVSYPKDFHEYLGWHYHDVIYSIEETVFPRATFPNETTIEKAIEIIDELFAAGGTNMKDALEIAIKLIETERRYGSASYQLPLIIFLTDGEPTIGTTNTMEIIEKISQKNIYRIPIMSLSFGDGADKDFLDILSLKNYGFTRHIYETADAALQLQNFYTEISSPLLTDIVFKQTKSIRNLTKTVFPIYFKGEELIVSGTIDDIDEFKLNYEINAIGIQGLVKITPTFEEPIGELEHHWAFLTVKQLLKEKNNKGEYLNHSSIIDIAMKYSFITPLTSLVVVQKDNVIVTNFDKTHKNVEVVTGETQTKQFFFISENEDLISDHNTKFETITELLNNYPWLLKIYNESDLSITLPQGKFKIGISMGQTTYDSCNNPPTFKINTPVCTLIHLCKSEVNLNNLTDYLKHFCSVENNFAGVCCPI